MQLTSFSLPYPKAYCSLVHCLLSDAAMAGDQASWLKHDPPVCVIKWDCCHDTPMQIALVWSFLRDLSEEKTRTQPGRWATPKKREHPVWPLGDTVEHVTLA
jgi:hypothetical protein